MAKIEHGLALAPNQSATKIAWLLANTPGAADRDLCFGTVDSWVAWVLSEGALHVTDHSNAAVTGLFQHDGSGWNDRVCEILGIPVSILPSLVDSSGVIGTASALPGAPPIAAMAGDQQASLVGQGCVHPGLAKITFGTGGMLDVCTGTAAPDTANRTANGTFPIVAWSHGGELTWGVEAVMLTAGTCIEWLRDDLGLIATSAESHDVAVGLCHVRRSGVRARPARPRNAAMGLRRPRHVARPDPRDDRAHVVRAVLEGVAHRGADMVTAAETDTGLTIPFLRVDGGMSANPTFVQALADATGKPVEVSPVAEATTLGAGLLAGLAVGVWSGLDDIAAAWSPARVVEPGDPLDRARWAIAVERAAGWIPELSALDF